MHFALNVLYWVLFAVTFFLVVNQLMYQEHSIIFNWYKEAPGFHVLWIMLVVFAVTVSISLVIGHDYRNAACVFLLGLAWTVFFLMYNRVIEIDVQNHLSSGDFPDDPPTTTSYFDEYKYAREEEALARQDVKPAA